MSKPFNSFLRCARARLDLRKPVLEIWTSQSIFFDGHCIRRLSRKAQSIGIASEREVNPRQPCHRESVIRSLSESGLE